MKVVVVNGFPRSGKDTFVDFCLEKLGTYGRKYSTVDFVKEIAWKCGWNGEKTPKNRKFLSDLKDLLTEWNDVPLNKTKQFIKEFEFEFWQHDISNDKGVVFVMCREPQEILKLKKELNAIAICIRRSSVENLEQSNHADSEVLNFDYDLTIFNDEGLDELKEKAIKFLDLIENI